MSLDIARQRINAFNSNPGDFKGVNWKTPSKWYKMEQYHIMKQVWNSFAIIKQKFLSWKFLSGGLVAFGERIAPNVLYCAIFVSLRRWFSIYTFDIAWILIKGIDTLTCNMLIYAARRDGGDRQKAGRAITYNLFLLLFSHDSGSYTIEQEWETGKA